LQISLLPPDSGHAKLSSMMKNLGVEVTLPMDVWYFLQGGNINEQNMSIYVVMYVYI
jgi:hypothetical protein